jgi:mono-ADP-ribosyltransferase sirtuin 6
MFAITPKYDCPHVKQCYNVPNDIKQLTHGIHNRPCAETGCGDTTENWVCLTCHQVHCSRYVKGHCMQHFLNNEDHSVYISMADLSCWCYKCEDYVVDNRVRSLVSEIHKDKFGYYPGERAPESTPKVQPKPNSTSHKTQKEIEEHFDDEEKVDAAARQVAQLLKKSKHAVIYTGAGISTSANIPDYRGPTGVWTLKDKGLRPVNTISIEEAFPTYGHYAIRKLVDEKLVKYVVSTNVDGLHRRSGVDEQHIAELHGNCYREVCSVCEKEYLRGYDVTNTVRNFTKHLTGRKCTCGGPLKDTIIHFSENLPERELKLAIKHAESSDLAIVLGTSMRVQPACSLPSMAISNKGDLVIVNLQITPYDDESEVRVFARTDLFLERVMKHLGMEEFDTTTDDRILEE